MRTHAPIIAPSITKLINLSFSSNVFPSLWKTAKVTPIFKSGDPTDVTNYCSISVLPILSKIAKRHVHNVLYSFLCENDLIYIRQSGFRSKHSTETALIKIIDDLLFNLDNDRVSGMVLVKKLEVYGISRDSLRWFTSYLKDRHRLFKSGDKLSSVAIVRHGIWVHTWPLVVYRLYQWLTALHHFIKNWFVCQRYNADFQHEQ